MPTTIEQDIQTNLASLFLTCTGIKNTYASLPPTVPPSELPAVFFLPGAARLTANQAPRWYELQRTYTIRFCVTPVQAGESGDAERMVIPFIYYGRLHILQHPTLNYSGTLAGGITWLADLEYQGDSGLVVVNAGEQYLGIEHTILITYKVPYAFALRE